MPTTPRSGKAADDFFAKRRVETSEEDMTEGERRRAGEMDEEPKE